jgi:hypothetical protein
LHLPISFRPRIQDKSGARGAGSDGKMKNRLIAGCSSWTRSRQRRVSLAGAGQVRRGACQAGHGMTLGSPRPRVIPRVEQAGDVGGSTTQAELCGWAQPRRSTLPIAGIPPWRAGG